MAPVVLLQRHSGTGGKAWGMAFPTVGKQRKKKQQPRCRAGCDRERMPRGIAEQRALRTYKHVLLFPDAISGSACPVHV